MTATHTFDIFCGLEGFGSHTGNWGGYWGKQGPELLEHRVASFSLPHHIVFGANTCTAFAQMLSDSTESSDVRDPWVAQMRKMLATALSSTLAAPLDCPDATRVRGNGIDIVARLKETPAQGGRPDKHSRGTWVRHSGARFVD